MIGPVNLISPTHRELKENGDVVDPNSFSAISFKIYDNFNSHAQLIMPNGTYTPSFGYYVLKKTDWKDVKFQLPQVHVPEGYYLKYWSYDLPKDGKITRDRLFRAHIGLEKYKNTPPVLGPFTNIESDEVNAKLSQVDRDDYAPIFFKVLNGGHFENEGKSANNLIYYVKHGQTWKQLKDNGMVVRTPKPNDKYNEFIEWRSELPKDNSYPSDNIYLAAFGTTNVLVAKYRPTDLNHPLDEKDPARPHPKSLTRPYDKNHYTAIAFIADGPGALYNYTSTDKALVYLIRNNKTWKDSFFGGPVPVADEGSVFVGWDSPVSRDNKIESKVYRAQFMTKEEFAKQHWDSPNAEVGKAEEDAHADAWEKEAESKDWDTPNAETGKAEEDAHADAWEKEAESKDWDTPNAEIGKAEEDAHADAWEKEAKTKDSDMPNVNTDKAEENSHTNVAKKEFKEEQQDQTSKSNQEDSKADQTPGMINDQYAPHHISNMDNKTSQTSMMASSPKTQSNQIIQNHNNDAKDIAVNKMKIENQQVATEVPLEVQQPTIAHVSASNHHVKAPIEHVATPETYTLSNKNHQEKNNKHEKMNELPKTGQNESKSPLLISALFTVLGVLLLRRLK
ncbi:LPXTG cell wall anchor domain-containing protein [Staphylococcus coagulans]|uniref:LPXTG cell wall anchor domain-containing protein n=1 Tax=Staphylococcus coagulans TaxID=74706 RepID=UPI0015FA745E|nr:LPXTG cell wall anchor domain-containing protein [Staphylococcus coagulans]MBA8762861.1 LPXTG cell wall anchor domain-containing protein [Staphylococcus coagulans]